MFAHTNLITYESLYSSSYLLNENLLYDKLWGPSQRVVTLLLFPWFAIGVISPSCWFLTCVCFWNFLLLLSSHFLTPLLVVLLFFFILCPACFSLITQQEKNAAAFLYKTLFRGNNFIRNRPWLDIVRKCTSDNEKKCTRSTSANEREKY